MWLPSFHRVRRSPPDESLAATEVSLLGRGCGAAGDIALACARQEPRPLDAYVELVHLAVEDFRREAEDVLAVQFLGDPCERGPELVLLLEQEEAAAGFLRQPLEAAIGARADPL